LLSNTGGKKTQTRRKEIRTYEEKKATPGKKICEVLGHPAHEEGRKPCGWEEDKRSERGGVKHRSETI